MMLKSDSISYFMLKLMVFCYFFVFVIYKKKLIKFAQSKMIFCVDSVNYEKKNNIILRCYLNHMKMVSGMCFVRLCSFVNAFNVVCVCEWNAGYLPSSYPFSVFVFPNPVLVLWFVIRFQWLK